MIPNEVKNDFDSIIDNEMFEMDRTLAAVMAATQSALIARGLALSGVMAQSLAQDATQSLKARAQFILGQLLRCLGSHRIELGTENVAEAVSLLREKN